MENLILKFSPLKQASDSMQTSAFQLPLAQLA